MFFSYKTYVSRDFLENNIKAVTDKTKSKDYIIKNLSRYIQLKDGNESICSERVHSKIKYKRKREETVCYFPNETSRK